MQRLYERHMEDRHMTLVDSTDAGPQVIPLWPGGAPGSEDWTQQEKYRPCRKAA